MPFPWILLNAWVDNLQHASLWTRRQYFSHFPNVCCIFLFSEIPLKHVETILESSYAGPTVSWDISYLGWEAYIYGADIQVILQTSERLLEIDVRALPLHIAALGEPLPDDCGYQTLISSVGSSPEAALPPVWCLLRVAKPRAFLFWLEQGSCTSCF